MREARWHHSGGESWCTRGRARLKRGLGPRGRAGRHDAALVPGLQDQVTVYRDDRGVAKIHAANQHDLFMAQG